MIIIVVIININTTNSNNKWILNNNNINNNNNEIPREKEILSWCPAGDSLISWVDKSSLALVGNPSRNGVLIKILVWRHLKPNLQLICLVKPSVIMSELCLVMR